MRVAGMAGRREEVLGGVGGVRESFVRRGRGRGRGRGARPSDGKEDLISRKDNFDMRRRKALDYLEFLRNEMVRRVDLLSFVPTFLSYLSLMFSLYIPPSFSLSLFMFGCVERDPTNFLHACSFPSSLLSWRSFSFKYADAVSACVNAPERAALHSVRERGIRQRNVQIRALFRSWPSDDHWGQSGAYTMPHLR
jgi:hypothetical protein